MRVGGEGAESRSCPCRHITDIGDLGEIDAHRSVPDGLHRCHVRVEQAGLAEPARGRESGGDAVSDSQLERIELCAPVDQPWWRHRALIIERIHRTSLYGITGQ